MTLKFTFGPVPSRRLGFSLGIDIIPLKTCTYNCVYCQLFQTSNHTITRQSFFNKEKILEDIKDSANKFSNIDYLTFSGSGEPTLNSDIGWLITEVKKVTDIPIAVITNGSLLWMPEVRQDLKDADLVVPSIDSVTQETWLKINRPAPNIKLSDVIEGTSIFCHNHKGLIWLEIMFVEGINDNSTEIRKIANFVNTLKADKVQINTVVRPPNEAAAKPLNDKILEDIAALFNHKTEIISPFKKVAVPNNLMDKDGIILELLTRRPCKLEEMSDSLGLDLNELTKYIKLLESEKKIMKEPSGFYSLMH